MLVLQLAHRAGHRVIAWVRPGTDAEELRRLGADQVITSAGDISAGSADAVFDAATLGQETIDVLKDGGAYVTFRGNEPVLQRGTRQVHIGVQNDGPSLRQLVDSVDAGHLELAGVTELPLEQVAQAQRRFAQGGLRDRLVLVP